MKKIIYFFIFSFFLSTILIASEKKIQVIDGDTIHIGKLKYRFFGIDAPEIKQICEKDNTKIQCGVIAKSVLKNKKINNFFHKKLFKKLLFFFVEYFEFYQELQYLID